MNEEIDLQLPWPPSVNRYWRHPTRGKLAGRHLISREGRAYREHVGWIVRQKRPLLGRLDVRLDVYPPNRIRRDIDNLPKAVFDAMTAAGVWLDDEQVDRLMIVRLGRTKGGAVRVRVREVPETTT